MQSGHGVRSNKKHLPQLLDPPRDLQLEEPEESFECPEESFDSDKQSFSTDGEVGRAQLKKQKSSLIENIKSTAKDHLDKYTEETPNVQSGNAD